MVAQSLGLISVDRAAQNIGKTAQRETPMASVIEKPGRGRRKPCSAAEWQMRIELAACYRLVHHFGLTDLIYNHITARVPDADHRYLINPYGLMYDEITASNLVKIDLDGTIVEDTEHEINPAGFVIHSAVHGARPDVVCVIHTHSRAGVAISALKEGLIPVNQGGFQFHNRIAYHDYEGFALDAEERKRLVADLGSRRAMILRNHGLLTAGRSVAEAFRVLYYLEQACQARLDALHSGREIVLPPDAVREHTAQQWEGGAAGIGTTTLREWPALLRMLDRRDPSYRD
jgi:ribulose-5-phosphate 4-epimerase/fuculose-1-phosphate aldolase